jgi:hypothetical protein
MLSKLFLLSKVSEDFGLATSPLPPPITECPAYYVFRPTDTWPGWPLIDRRLIENS